MTSAGAPKKQSTMNLSGRQPSRPFAHLPPQTLERMAEAGAEVRNCMRVLAKSNENIVAELLRDSSTFYEWDHYPQGDVYDPESHSQYYYHAHAEGERPGEHGHFHTFLRAPGMPKGVRPLDHPGNRKPERPADALSHLIGIGMDYYGAPVSLFATNRWVTDEVWYKATDVIRMLDRFEIDLARPSWLVNRWITALVRLFHPQIEALLEARDARIAEHEKAHPRRNVFDDRQLEVAAEIKISVDKQIAAVEAALKKSGGGA